MRSSAASRSICGTATLSPEIGRRTSCDQTIATTGKPLSTATRNATLPYYNPHSLRQTLMRLAYDMNLNARELKAWSQNLGHDAVQTSLINYGSLSEHEQADVMRGLTLRDTVAPDVDSALAMLHAALGRSRAA